MGKLIVGVNDLETWCKENNMNHLVEEWNDESNITNFTKGSNYKAKWRCGSCGYEWQARIGKRTYDRTGCPKCNSQTSFPEQAIFYYIKQYFSDTIHRCKNLGFELDIYIPSIQTAIEYDGLIYHKHKSKIEKNKNRQCKNYDITLIRIREEGLCEYDDCVCIFRKKPNDLNNFNATLKKLFDCLNISDVDIDIHRDYSKILENYKTLLLKNSLSAKKPKIAAEWHPTLNGELKPENFSFSSGHVVWWRCDKGHEWQAIIGNRSRNKHNCPYCSGRRTLIGFNDLQTWCKKENMNHLAEEWDDKNNITDFTKGSNYEAKWRCRFCGYEWQAVIKGRVKNKYNCPRCSGYRTLAGFNDLQTWCKKNNMNHLVEEWNDEKSITNFTKGSNYKAKWRCGSCGYEWQASIVHRTHSSAGCPECAKKTIARKKAKKVLCIDTGEIFNSLSAASRTKNTAISYISQCCRGKQRTAGGYHWRYVNENE